jgi:cytochrome c oxidase subunit 2
MASSKILRRIVASAVALAGAGAAAAHPVAGVPVPWQIGMQPAASPVMEAMNEFHNLLLVIITLIALFVLALMIYVMVRFNAKRNPTPSKTTHNTMIEAIPSFKLLFYQVETPEAEVTIKAIGHQWYWSYEYPDDGFTFDAMMLAEEDLEPGQPRLLATDAPVVVPVGKVVRVLITADDVVHSWAVPSFGIKTDSVPGRLNETWFLANETGTYYGQCSELCGAYHAFMPIEVKVVGEAEYEDWLVSAREKYARIAGYDEVRVVDTGQR